MPDFPPMGTAPAGSPGMIGPGPGPAGSPVVIGPGSHRRDSGSSDSSRTLPLSSGYQRFYATLHGNGDGNHGQRPGNLQHPHSTFSPKQVESAYLSDFLSFLHVVKLWKWAVFWVFPLKYVHFTIVLQHFTTQNTLKMNSFSKFLKRSKFNKLWSYVKTDGLRRNTAFYNNGKIL